MKYCPRCTSSLPEESFSKNITKLDGLEIWCRECRKSYRHQGNQKAKTRQYNQSLYNSDPIKACERAAVWKKLHPAEVRARQRAYYDANREEILSKSRAYNKAYSSKRKELDALRYKKNRSSILERLKKYNKEHPETARRNSQIRRSRKLGLSNPMAPVTKKGLEEKLVYWGRKCYLCNEEIIDGLHWDHVKPLTKGGMDILSNLRPTHAVCNIRKHSQWPIGGGDHSIVCS